MKKVSAQGKSQRVDNQIHPKQMKWILRLEDKLAKLKTNLLYKSWFSEAVLM